MKRLVSYIAGFGTLAVIVFVGLTAQVYAQDTAVTTPPTSSSIADKICQGVITTETGQRNQSTTVAACAETGEQSFAGLTHRIIDIFSIVVGAVSVIMIIIGGFRYIISGGDSTGVTAAKNTILYAIVGLVIVLFSQIIIRFVLSNFQPR